MLYITERAVFRLAAESLELIEIAPGVDLEKDILSQMDFKPQISVNLKLMDARIFYEQAMDLKIEVLYPVCGTVKRKLWLSFSGPTWCLVVSLFCRIFCYTSM
ncbi:hypothetical protein [Agarivorans sp. Z349TD_8]|uniref:hypothetical protein n=1 Tax=Agarivorans sp. Z349TD_8 TaxID=3421434 RepID=UPI003D7CF628